MTDHAQPVAIPEEFLDPEGDGEEQDPDLAEDESGLEATTSALRKLWSQWMCRNGDGRFADVKVFGKGVGGVPEPAVDAYKAFERALRSAGYQPGSQWAYNCRKIAGTNSFSLHSAGIAIDIDPEQNPYSHGNPFSGKIKEHHVNAVLAIKNSQGQSVWSWGGSWSKPDRMHFQLDQGPSLVDVDWATVPGERPTKAMSPVHSPEQAPGEEEENVLTDGATGQAVVDFQNMILSWDSTALPEWGADGDYGNETIEAVKRFQQAKGLDPTGKIDGVTAALLVSSTTS